MKLSKVRLLVDDTAAAFRRVLHVRDPAGNLVELFQSIPMAE